MSVRGPYAAAVRALAIVAILGLAAGAHADELDDARALEASLQYERALALITGAIARGGASPDHLAQLELEAGKLAAGLERPAEAEDHFARALALRPALALPDGSSPKLTAPFESARARVRPLAIGHALAGSRLSITASDDALHLATAARASYVDAAGHRQELVTRDGPPYELELPGDARDVDIAVLDAHGNHLYEARAHREAAPAPAPAPIRPRAAHWYRRWSTWAIAGGVGLAGAATCAWRLGVAQDEWNHLNADPTAHDYSQLRAVEDRGRAWALGANVGLGLAAAGAALAVVAYVTSDRGDRLVLTAGPTSLGVAGRF